MKKKTLLITGGNSLIGKDILNFFKKKNYDISITYKQNKIPKLKNIKQIKFDFNKKLYLPRNFDYLIHLAASTPAKSKNDLKLYSTNVKGTYNLLNSKIKFKKILLISSVSIYGKVKKKILKENHKPHQPSFYGKSKLMMEKIITKYAEKNKINFLILRLPGVIGNFRSKTNFMNNIFEKLFENQNLTFSNPESYFNNIIHTETLCKIINNFFSKNVAKNQTVNLSSKKKERLKILINLIKSKLKSKSSISYSNSYNSFYISNQKVKKLNINIISTRNSINKTIKYYKNL